MTSATCRSRSGTSTFGLMSSSGRPRSAWTTFRMLLALGVKRRIRRSRSRMMIGMSTVASRFSRSLLTCVEFLIAVLELVVDGGQLLVRRLQLFFRGLELLVHALELFVARDQLLVGRTEIVVRPPVLLDERLQVLLRRARARAPAWEVAGAPPAFQALGFLPAVAAVGCRPSRSGGTGSSKRTT